MKNLLVIIVTILTSTVQGQITIFGESNFNGLNTFGLEYKNQKGFGVYVSGGGNLLEKSLGFDNKQYGRVEGDFTSTVSWYTEDGSYYRQLPNNVMFTTKEWGNRVLDKGTCVNTVKTWWTDKVVTQKVLNVGVVVPIKNVNIRIGGGIYNKTEVGQTKHDYWSNTFHVTKYYDEWGVVARPSGIFVVTTSSSVNEYEDFETINTNVTTFNLNMAVEIKIKDRGNFSFGFDSNGGINFGFGYNLTH